MALSPRVAQVRRTRREVGNLIVGAGPTGPAVPYYLGLTHPTKKRC